MVDEKEEDEEEEGGGRHPLMFSTNTVRCPDYALNERQDIIHSAAFQGAVRVINTLVGRSAVQTKQEMLFTADFFFLWWMRMMNAIAGSSAVQTKKEILFTLDFFFFFGGGGGGGVDEGDECISRKFSSTNEA